MDSQSRHMECCDPVLSVPGKTRHRHRPEEDPRSVCASYPKTSHIEGVCPEVPKTSLVDISLASSIVESYGFADSTVFTEVSQSRMRAEKAVWIDGV